MALASAIPATAAADAIPMSKAGKHGQHAVVRMLEIGLAQGELVLGGGRPGGRRNVVTVG
ncbi:hypothetical protein ACP70R_008182 [Stipagrostis hirtigluma subsp. patula]